MAEFFFKGKKYFIVTEEIVLLLDQPLDYEKETPIVQLKFSTTRAGNREFSAQTEYLQHRIKR